MLYLPLSCYQGRIRPPCWWHAHEGLSVWMQWAVFEWRLALPLTNPGISHSASHTSLLTCGKRIMATPTSVGRKETKRGKNACESLWPQPPMGEALSKGQSQRLSCRWNVVSVMRGTRCHRPSGKGRCITLGRGWERGGSIWDWPERMHQPSPEAEWPAGEIESI